MSRARLALGALVVLAVLAFFAAGGPRILGFDNLKAQQALVQDWYASHPWRTALGFFAAYVAVTGLSVPGALVLTLIAGALFGVLWGTVIVSFASTIGATLAFLSSRYLLRDWVQERFAHHLVAVNEGMRKDGALYLFGLRLLPVVPFFAINLAMGLTPIRSGTFYAVSQAGMLAGTIVYVNAGTQLSRIDSPAGIVSLPLLGALALLAFFPLAAKKLVDALKARRVYARWKKPRRFDRNLIVIGAGSAGLVSAYIAAAVRAKVTLIEKHRMGGDCLNTGCVPSKALLKSARVLALIRRAQEFGLKAASAEVDFAQVMERVQRVVKAVEPHDSAARYAALGVECIEGEACLRSPWSVEVKRGGETRTLTARAIIIAAGARPFVPPIPGIEGTEVLTSENIWQLRALPRRLVVLGGGPIGCELAQAFACFGAQVTVVEKLPRLLPREDPEASAALEQRLRAEGLRILSGHEASAIRVAQGRRHLVARAGDSETLVEFDALLCALGRVPSTAGYGLEELGIPVTKSGAIATDEYLRTAYPNIYACGDVAGPYQFTHAASHQAWHAAVNALFGWLRRFRVDYSVMPWATFTEPEVARVGLNETEAKARGIAYELTTYGLAELDRAITEGEAYGFVRVLTVPGKDRILGATIVGEHAGELITEFVSAMRHGLGLGKILGTIHIYPTLAEASKQAAGTWKRAHAPEGLLRKVERLHAWMRA